MQGTNIPNVHQDIPGLKLVQAKIDPKIFNYFFHECLIGCHGPRQAMITLFFQRLYEACQAQGIAGPWDEDIEGKINAVLQRVNFQDLSGGVESRHADNSARTGPIHRQAGVGDNREDHRALTEPCHGDVVRLADSGTSAPPAQNFEAKREEQQ